MDRHFHLLLRSALLPCMAVASALCAVSCVDKDFRLGDISSEITIGGEDFNLPLGYVGEKTLGEIIGTGIEEMKADSEGNYSVGYTGNGSFAIDGISEEGFSSGSQSASADIAYPNMEITDSQGNIDDSIAIQIPNELNAITVLPVELHSTVSDSGTVGVNLDLTIPKQIKSIDKIYLGADERGARFDVTFAFNGLAPINGGGKASLKITAPAGYELWDGADASTAGESITVTRTIADGAESCTFVLYLRSIDTSTRTIADGKMTFDEKLQWAVGYEFTAKAGKTFNPSYRPQLSIVSTITYRDADVTLNEFSLDDTVHRLGENIVVQNIIKEVRYVSEVVLKNTRLTFRITGIDWLGDELADAANVKIKLPDMFVLAQNTGLTFDNEGNIDTDLKQLREGLTIGLDKIVPDEVHRSPDKDGRIDLDFGIDLRLGDIRQGLKLKASELLHRGGVSVGIEILDTKFYIESIAGRVAYSATEKTSIDLGDIARYDVEVGDLDVSPVLRFAVDNPFSIPIDAEIDLIPYKNGAKVTENTVTIGGVAIAAATRTESAHTDIVIAKADRKSEYPTAQFVAADITRVFKGQMPDRIEVMVKAATDSERAYTIYARERYDVAYNYDVDIPLEIGNAFSIAYTETVDDLNDTFADLADKNITVGEIEVVAKVANSTPLDFAIDAQMLDAQGNPTTAQVVIDKANDTAFGSTDGTVRKSDVVLRLSLGEGNNLRTLADIASMRLTLTADAPKNGMGNLKINKNQTLSATLTLNVKGGVTFDLDNINE